MHDFDRSLREGQDGEKYLDWFLSGFVDRIEAATRSEERAGIDRWFYRGGRRWSVQYKTDKQATSTGNAFIEMGHWGHRYHQDGWLFTCQASELYYYPRFSGLIYRVNPDRIRQVALDNWIFHRRIGRAVNSGYVTGGLLVPLPEFAGQVEEVIRVRVEEQEQFVMGGSA